MPSLMTLIYWSNRNRSRGSKVQGFRVAFFATGWSFSDAPSHNPRRGSHSNPENRGSFEPICQNQHALPTPRVIHSVFLPKLESRYSGKPGTCERLR